MFLEEGTSGPTDAEISFFSCCLLMRKGQRPKKMFLLLLRALFSLVFSLSQLLQWLLRVVTTVLFFRFRRRSSKPRHLITAGAGSAGLEWQITLLLMSIISLLGVVLLLLPRVCRAVSVYLRRADLRSRRRAGGARPQLPQNLPRKFSLWELEVATSKFSDKRKLGSGSFGVVYEGRLPNGVVIAVKKLNLSVVSGGGSDSEDVTKLQFENEARLLQLRHGNIVQLLGYCCQRQHWLLCYEHMARGSLDRFLFGKCSILDWAARYKIIKGICCGLRYLHEECEKQTLHLDIKPSNILLDNAMNPKISDFGMSRLFDKGSTQNMSKFYAPVGYSPPEYAYGGKVSAKTDIFSFGILLLEIATDKSNVSFSRTPQKDEFIDYVTQYTVANKLNLSKRLPPPDYVKDDCFSQFRNCIKTGLKCVSMDENKRPSAGDVMDILNRH